MSKDGRIWLSHTGLEVLERCPRCFWLQYNKGIRQPEGIISRLANRFDVILKKYFNQYRSSGEIPPIVQESIKGKLQNPFIEKYFVPIDQNIGFFGKLDECLVNDSGELLPIDFKTSSSDPREKETLNAYQSQIDAYLFLLQNKGQKISGYGYLIYFFPDDGQLLHQGFPMIVYTKKISGDPQRTKNKIYHAIKVLEGSMPLSSDQCNFCRWHETVSQVLFSSVKKSKQLSLV